MKIMHSVAGLTLLCAALAAHASAAHAVDVNALSESQVAVMDVSTPSLPGKSFFAATIMSAPLRKLCAIIMDYPDYPNFMPNTEKAQVVLSANDYDVVDMTLKLPLGKIKKYRLKLEPKTGAQSCQLSWRLIPWEALKPEETIADTSGYWQLTPHPSNKDKTVVEYFVYADPGPVPFGLRWIVDIMSRESLPKTLEAVRGKATPQ